MILDLYQQKFLYIQSSSVQAYIFIRPKGHWSTYQDSFVILINTLTFLENKIDIYIREKS